MTGFKETAESVDSAMEIKYVSFKKIGNTACSIACIVGIGTHNGGASV